MNDERGSKWREWDLHVHSPQSIGGDYDEFIKNLSSSKPYVIGINDYCSINGYKTIIEKGGVPEKILFPVIELRMNNILANRNSNVQDSGVRINFHVILNNAPKKFRDIETWANSLKCHVDGKTILLGGFTGDLSKLTFDFEEVINSLQEAGLRDDAIIWLPYDEYGGIGDVNPNDNFFKLALIKLADIMGSSSKKQIDFFKWRSDKFTQEQFKNWFDKPKACIKGSDAHEINYPFGKLKNEKSEPIEKYCWIKADLTFEGLKQVIHEPDRVFIGELPEMLSRIYNTPTKFIERLQISKIENSSLDEPWFDNLNIKLNGGLVAIIGNKGSGKSALADIISLCGNTHNAKNFSFLTEGKFRKKKPLNKSQQFRAKITWRNKSEDAKLLSENTDDGLIEKVKYIPQDFLETLCTAEDSQGFEQELRKIIFSRTPQSERLGATSLDELIGKKSEVINDTISKIKNDLNVLNDKIAELEKKRNRNYRSTMNDALEQKKRELAAHLLMKPTAVSAPEASEAHEATNLKIAGLREQIVSLEQTITEKNEEKLQINVAINELTKASQALENLTVEHNEYVRTQTPIFEKNDIEIANVITYKANKQPITKRLTEKSEALIAIDQVLGSAENSLPSQIKTLDEEIRKLKEQLDAPSKTYQKYLSDLKLWQAGEKNIKGDALIEGSLAYYEEILRYIDQELGSEYNNTVAERLRLIESFYEKKNEIIDLYRQLFKPVTDFIEENKPAIDSYNIKLDVSFQLQGFVEKFFDHISAGAKGSFREDGQKRMKSIIDATDFNTKNGFSLFINEIIDNVLKDKRTEPNEDRELADQLKKGYRPLDFYNFIFSLDYLVPVYKLQLGEKDLSELSPGERGALLLIFYLLLDNDDIPLIIDQPEENLDNQSVYKILVHFIKQVKDRRQIIIITHNPNLAVVCDAEQIIYVKIAKDEGNKMTYITGAIENPEINKNVVEILEGTFPAFDNRTAKYKVTKR